MIKITICERNGKIWAFQVKGHSGYAEEGSDIVCSGVSVATQMAVVGLKEVLKLQTEVDIEEGYLHLELLKSEEYEKAQDILLAMKKTLEDIAKNYAKYVKLEVKKDVY
ncbi:MAG: ribosomal-processing cysteine protease Prp [Clostridia bacterium]|nr:ribosomal-processing cysteine protease Prp [Clostridia bacterium]